MENRMRTELEIRSLKLRLLIMRGGLVLSSGRLSRGGSLLEQSVDAHRGRGAGRVEQGDYILDSGLRCVSERSGSCLLRKIASPPP